MAVSFYRDPYHNLIIRTRTRGPKSCNCFILSWFLEPGSSNKHVYNRVHTYIIYKYDMCIYIYVHLSLSLSFFLSFFLIHIICKWTLWDWRRPRILQHVACWGQQVSSVDSTTYGRDLLIILEQPQVADGCLIWSPISMCTCVCICIYIHIYIYISYMYMHMHKYVCIHIHIYICICICLLSHFFNLDFE